MSLFFNKKSIDFSILYKKKTLIFLNRIYKIWDEEFAHLPQCEKIRLAMNIYRTSNPREKKNVWHIKSAPP